MCNGKAKRCLGPICVVLLVIIALAGCQKKTVTEIEFSDIPNAAMQKYFNLGHNRDKEHSAAFKSGGVSYLIVSVGRANKLQSHIKFLNKAEVDADTMTIYFETYDPQIPYTISPVEAAQITDFQSIIRFRRVTINGVNVVIDDELKYTLRLE